MWKLFIWSEIARVVVEPNRAQVLHVRTHPTQLYQTWVRTFKFWCIRTMFTINSFIKRTKSKVSQAYPSGASICLITLVESNVHVLYEKWKQILLLITWHATLKRMANTPSNGDKHTPLHPSSNVAQDLM